MEGQAPRLSPEERRVNNTKLAEALNSEPVIEMTFPSDRQPQPAEVPEWAKTKYPTVEAKTPEAEEESTPEAMQAQVPETEDPDLNFEWDPKVIEGYKQDHPENSSENLAA